MGQMVHLPGAGRAPIAPPTQVGLHICARGEHFQELFDADFRSLKRLKAWNSSQSASWLVAPSVGVEGFGGKGLN
jgi:hypothetical protein